MQYIKYSAANRLQPDFSLFISRFVVFAGLTKFILFKKLSRFTTL